LNELHNKHDIAIHINNKYTMMLLTILYDIDKYEMTEDGAEYC